MIKTRNSSITNNRRRYEIFFSTEDAQHIAKHFINENDTAHHLNFIEIEELLKKPKAVETRQQRTFYIGMVNGILCEVVAYLQHGRCIVKSGRICSNFEFHHYKFI